MAFPVSLPDDGLIDITIQPLVSTFWMNIAQLLIVSQSSRSDVLKEMEGAPRGEAYWSPKVRVVSYSSTLLLLTASGM